MDKIYGTALVGEEDYFSKKRGDTFKKDINNFGILKWNVEDPSLGVEFLDLALKTDN